MTTPYSVTICRESCIRGCCRGRSRYRGGMFPEHIVSGSDTGIPTHSAQMEVSYTASPNTAAIFAHVPALLVTPSRTNSVNSSEAERSSSFEVPPQALSDRSGMG